MNTKALFCAIPAFFALFLTLPPASHALKGESSPNQVLFLSDFGLFDDSVSQCKAVMQAVNPSVRITDITHNVPAYNIRMASFYLADSATLWPKGSVFVAVVDPGVGTARRPIAIRTKSGHYFVGPDNGIFTLPILKLGLDKAVHIENLIYLRKDITTTFHGRDIYAPVAARLASDPKVFSRLGKEIKNPVTLSRSEAEANLLGIKGTILHVEAPYGNVWTDASGEALKSLQTGNSSPLSLSIGTVTIAAPVAATFGDVPQGEPLIYVNSRGLISFALNMASFAERYGVSESSSFEIRPSTADLVDMMKVRDSNMFFDIRYATKNNFTGRQVYPEARCVLKRPAAAALLRAASAARKAPEPFSLCILDCYRPLSVQKIFWGIMPDERYVADPAKGSLHNRGMAVDAAACDGNGKWLELPTAFDDFTEKARRDYAGLTPAQIANRTKLEKVFRDAGFEGLPTEWWHFDYPGWETAPVLDEAFPR